MAPFPAAARQLRDPNSSFIRRNVPPVSAVETAFTESSLRYQQLGVWRAGEKMLREQLASSDRAAVEAARGHEAALAGLHSHFESEASSMYTRVRCASVLKVATAQQPGLLGLAWL
tara:strand:- start:9 stop:356 length:348 start_codon:yes stop_codon:yes gene_type:complete